MESELITALKYIKSKTDIDIDVFAETKKFFVSTRENHEITLPCDLSFDEYYCDKEADKTYFKIKYKNANLIGMIDGCEDTQRNYAIFITSYIESLSAPGNNMQKNEYLKNIVLGDCTRLQIQKYMRKFMIADVACYVLVLTLPSGKAEEIIDFLENYTTNQLDCAVVVDDTSCVFVRFVDNNLENEYQSSNDYAVMLADSIKDELNIVVNIGVGGTVKNLLDVNISYQQAAAVLRMSTVFESKGNVHTYKEYILVKMLEDIPKFKLTEYLDILLDPEAKTIFQDEDMVNTAEEFFNNNLNVSETSRTLFMHRNTLMYRLDKIDRATGLNLRKFPDAITFRIITILYKILG